MRIPVKFYLQIRDIYNSIWIELSSETMEKLNNGKDTPMEW